MGVIEGTLAELWLSAFAEAVRDRDFDTARRMFSEEATGFGTVTPRYSGLDELEQQQWVPVWDRTEGFGFDLDSATVLADGALTSVVTEWSSVGVDHGGERRPRHGRATIVLAEADGELKALHTHFSMSPGFVA